MSGRRIFAIARRIAEQFRRDPRSLGLVFIAPLVIVALLGWVMRDQQTLPTRFGVVNEAGDPGAAFAGQLEAAAVTAGMSIVAVGSGATAAEDAIRSDVADLVVVLPAGFAGGGPASGPPPPIQVVAAGIRPGDDATRVAQLQAALRELMPPNVVQLEFETVYGAGIGDPLAAFAPALVGYLSFFFVFILTGISFLRERVGGTLERLLSTPVGRGDIVVGYSAGFAVFATVQVTLILLFALSTLAFQVGDVRIAIGLGVPSAGEPALALAIAVLSAIGAVNLGVFLSTFARTEFQILQFIPIVIIPQGLLSGIFWSIESLPDVLQPIALLMPLTYAIDGLRQVLIIGAGLEARAIQVDLLVLAAFALLFVLIGSRTIRREVV